MQPAFDSLDRNAKLRRHFGRGPLLDVAQDQHLAIDRREIRERLHEIAPQFDRHARRGDVVARRDFGALASPQQQAAAGAHENPHKPSTEGSDRAQRPDPARSLAQRFLDGVVDIFEGAGAPGDAAQIVARGPE